MFLGRMLTTLPTPTPTESQERFIIRAHKSLMTVLIDPEKRSEAVWLLWRRHRGLTEEERIAEAKFPPDRFVKKENVCVFTEHEAGGVRNDLIEMIRIIRGCNHRIADFDGFAPIADGHTPDPNNPFGVQPDILGYTGPYRLGMIGRKQLRWAIFADEWHMRETAGRLSALPRRSPELWRFKSDPNRVHFDPIAALGAVTPRIPLPFKCSRQVDDDVTVEKYSFDASGYCAPGGNTHVKTFSKETYSMALSNEDISQLLAALMQTPQFQFLDQQMKASQTAGDGAAANAGAGDANANPDDLAALSELAGAGGGNGQPPPEVPDKNAAGIKYSARNGEAVIEKYQALQNSHNRLMQDFGQAQSQISALHKRAADSDRTTALMGLRQKYGEFIDLEDELSRTLYSRGASLNDEAFASHVATVEKYAQRASQHARLHATELPMGVSDYGNQDADVQKYQAALSAEAVRVHTKAVNAGKYMTYDEAVSEAKKSVGEGPTR